ncbi:MAG TPA: hypothetical protein ENG93_03395 [Nitrospirae bacterium]|nr:hypothetical protein [Nitrospirota bacterium]
MNVDIFSAGVKKHIALYDRLHDGKSPEVTLERLKAIRRDLEEGISIVDVEINRRMPATSSGTGGTPQGSNEPGTAGLK